jgi:dienelactone hydrolase
MSKQRIVGLLLGVLCLIVVVPVVVARFESSSSRTMTGVSLADTTYQEVQFSNEEQDVELAGMLFVPEGVGPHPAAVIIHGSGTSRRDNGWYLTLTDYLVNNGIAVLLPDKRGSEQSEGDWRSSSFEDLATDTVAAVSYLKNQQDFDVSKIGIVGMSQGGHIAPLVASESTDVEYLVNVVGGVAPMHDQLIYEENHNLRQMGFLPGVSDAVARLSTAWLIHVGQKEFWNAIGNFDNAPYWEKLSIPALVLYGEIDTNVDSRHSAERLESLQKPNVKVTIFKGSGHALEDPPQQGNSIFREDALEQIVEFIRADQVSE